MLFLQGVAGLVGDPVDFPGSASVVGEGLLEVGRGVQVGPFKADEDGFAVDRVLGEEFAAAVFEFADLRRVDNTNSFVGPVEAPLVGFGIVSAEGEALDVTGGAVDEDLINLGTVIDLAADPGAIKFDPGVRAGEGIEAPPETVFPGAEERVEVVGAVAFSGLRGGRGWILSGGATR